ncbi:hypothetical protein MMC10_000590 [Thelotrema lepadinum]|nr:hypothetical protein [Thelotrema lepadinum]
MSSISAENLFNVKGMVFVVTGAGSGLGLMMAQALDANGAAKVYALGRRLDKLEEAAKSCASLPCSLPISLLSPLNKSIIPLQTDVTSQPSLSAAAAHISTQTPFINHLIANSGITGPTIDHLPPKPSLDQLQSHLWNVDIDSFTNTFAVNTSAPFYTTLAFLKLLDEGNRHPESVGSLGGGKGVRSSVVVSNLSFVRWGGG